MKGIEVTKEVREAESEILAGYTQMATAIYKLSSLTRTVGMDRDAIERALHETFFYFHNALEDAGFPRNPDDPDLHLEARMKMLITMLRQHENIANQRLKALQECHEILTEAGVAGGGPIVNTLPERIRLLLETTAEQREFWNKTHAE